MAELVLGRVVGSKIYSGVATTNDDIVDYLDSVDITPLLHDVYLDTAGGMWQYQMSENDLMWVRIRSLVGPAGTFRVSRTYETIALMNADFNNVALGALVIISSPTGAENEDNAKLYVRGETQFNFLTDMSGAEGLKGEQGEQGVKGDTGKGISSVAYTSTNGLVDKYTITYTAGTPTTFNVTNGKGIESIAAYGDPVTASDGRTTQTYKITYNNNSTSTYDVISGPRGGQGFDGRGIDSIEAASGDPIPSGIPQSVVTLTITFNDGSDPYEVDVPTIMGRAGVSMFVTDDMIASQYVPLNELLPSTDTKMPYVGDFVMYDGDIYEITEVDIDHEMVEVVSTGASVKGERGATGSAAHITSMTAGFSTDSNNATPRVSVASGGTDLARTYDLNFINLVPVMTINELGQLVITYPETT